VSLSLSLGLFLHLANALGQMRIMELGKAGTHQGRLGKMAMLLSGLIQVHGG
jgi:hypothetical protein